MTAPARTALPDRPFSDELVELRRRALAWIEPFYDAEHLRRTADWLLALEPDADEPLVIAALTHDMERSVPGGPVLDLAHTPWDDPEYNRLHCERSAEVVADWLRTQGASERFVAGVRRPILEHETGGSAAGDLLQAADSLSWLEVNSGLVVSWILRGACDVAKGKDKLRWMYDRIRRDDARAIAEPWYRRSLELVDRRLADEGGVLTGVMRCAGTSRLVQAGGLRLHLLEYGDPAGPPLVIVPGITSPAATWEFVAQELAGDFHVFTLDLRGRGLSDKPASGYTLMHYAGDLTGVVTGLGLDHPVILGHSVGARFAVAFGSLHPRLRGPLIVVDPPVTGPGRPAYATPLSAFLDGIRSAKDGAGADAMRPLFPSWTEEQLTLRARWLATCDETAVAETYRLMHEEDLFPHWRRLRAPTLLLCGEESPAVDVRSAAELAHENPAADVVAVERAGHMVPWDNLAGFLEPVRRFAAAAVRQ